MSRANAITIRRQRKGGYAETHSAGRSGNVILCMSCRYFGAAEVIESTVLAARKLERCPECKSLNYEYKELKMGIWMQDEWQGCYPSNWKGLIVAEAMSHPAKFSSRLIHKIYEHMQAEGWVKSGDTVIDPFGGVALGALEAMQRGLHWRGIELEAKFVDLGRRNIESWNLRFGSMPKWNGDAQLLQGDSRKLLDVMAASPHTAVISSPPYADSLSTDLLPKAERVRVAREAGISNAENISPIDMEKLGLRHQTDYGQTDGQLGAMGDDGFDVALSSPPFEQRSADGGWQMFGKYAEEGKLTVKQVKGNGHQSYPSWDKERDTSYGESDGQMSKMQSGDFDVALSSPPFLQATGGTPEPKPGSVIDESLYKRHAAGNAGAHGYGEADGQLSAMGDEGFDSAVSSPPFMEQQKGGGIANAMNGGNYEITTGMPGINSGYQNQAETAGKTAGNLGEASFWMAAREILDQVYFSLKPGGKSVWVVKGYVKNKQYVDFPDQWRRLCEAAGFVTLHEHHAMLVHHKGVSHTLEGGTVEHKTESKSFFRRLAEKKGSPKIDFETVFCMEKPE